MNKEIIRASYNSDTTTASFITLSLSQWCWHCNGDQPYAFNARMPKWMSLLKLFPRIPWLLLYRRCYKPTVQCEQHRYFSWAQKPTNSTRILSPNFTCILSLCPYSLTSSNEVARPSHHHSMTTTFSQHDSDTSLALCSSQKNEVVSLSVKAAFKDTAQPSHIDNCLHTSNVQETEQPWKKTCLLPQLKKA